MIVQGDCGELHSQCIVYYALATDRCWAFARNWNYLRKRGACDAWGSAEYRRVLCAWFAQCCPMPIHRFITDQANRPSWIIV